MSDFAADVEGLNTLIAALEAAGPRVGRGAAAAVRKTTLDVEATAKAFAPVDTGNLRNSIGHEFTGDGRSAAIEGVVGPTADYGAHVEFGTVKMAPRAYLGPALDRHGYELIDALNQVAGDIL